MLGTLTNSQGHLRKEKHMNSWSGTGRVAKEPDVRYGAQSQTAVGRFTLAVEKNYKKNKDDKANFISIVCFGKTAEFVEKYVKKGKRVAIYNGEITTGSYEKNDGTKVYTTDVIAGKVEVIDWPDKDENPPEQVVADSFAAISESVPF